MGKKQARRTLNVSARTYEKLEVYSESTGRSMAGIVEELVKLFLDREQQEQEHPLVPKPQAMPPTSEHEYWEPGALELIAIMKEKGGSMSLRAVKTAMRFRKYKVSIAVNILSYLDLTKRAEYDRETKMWYLTK